MKSIGNNQNRAAALITTLILVSAVVLLTVSYFAISRNEARISASHLSGTRSELAERAAFEDARNLLISLTGNDEYLITSVMHDSPGSTEKTRYTFLTQTSSEEIKHIPLFCGGEISSSDMPNLNQLSTETLADVPVAAPPVTFNGSPESGKIETYGLTHLDESGAITGENRFPETVIQEPGLTTGEKYEMRYTYWIEDLEGLPNIDVVGGWTDHYDLSNGLPVSDLIRPGYSSFDSRTLPGDPTSRGVRIPLPENETIGWQFPKSFRGQLFSDQVAPGLSPREILLQPWSTNEMSIVEHPYNRAGSLISARHWLAPGGSYIRSSAIRKENRFILGLRPYLQVPRIPYGHDYADEGEIRHNLNELVSQRYVSSNDGRGGIREIIARNLPDFAPGREGGFPAEEDYLATLAANAIDYADEDKVATYSGNVENQGNYSFRGVDSYCTVNEFFVRFEYRGYQDKGTHWDVIFVATPYVEFWNTGNQTAEMNNVSLEFSFLEPIQFKTNLKFHRIEEDDITKNEPADNPLTFTVAPNQILVRSFGEVRWEVEVPKPESSPIAFPIIQDLRGVDRVTTRADYKLWIGEENSDDILVDYAGRTSDREANEKDYGFFFTRYKSLLQPKDYFMRMTVPPVAGKAFGFNAGFTSHLGDPWMSYYSKSTFEEANYDRKGSPAYRNFDSDKAGRDWYKDEIRIRDWPDGGYDSEVIPEAPENDEMPDTFTSVEDPELAPWRISNEGRFFSVTELGNLHDPVMWVAGDSSAMSKQSSQLFSTYRDSHLKSLPEDAIPNGGWGGGNTLRIGRPEHQLFDQPGLRASQLLDLFQTGFTGTNLKSLAGNDDIYRHYDPRDHQPPPSAPNATEATQEPYSLLYPETLHAEGIFQQRFGHINLNGAPSVFEIETLLRGPFASSAILPEDGDPVKGPKNSKPLDELALQNSPEGNSSDGIHQVALGLFKTRPFLSPSHLARVLSKLMDEHGVYPKQANDAQMEETFARLFNTTSFSSRHFRIFTYGEIVHAESQVVAGRSRRAYVVFLRPVHEADGSISDVRLEILSSRDL